jgi:hypothetical protein
MDRSEVAQLNKSKHNNNNNDRKSGKNERDE